MGTLLPEMPAVVVGELGARRAAHGNPLRVADIVSGAPGTSVPPPNAGQVRVLDKDGRLLAIANQRPDGALHPKIVLVVGSTG